MIFFWNWLKNLFKVNQEQVSTKLPIKEESQVENTESVIVKTPKKRALLVGIDKYNLPGANLNGCVNDVWDVYDLLTKNYSFDPDDVRVVIDERATFENIEERLRWLIDVTEAGDEAVFYHSGHGSQVRDRSGDELVDRLDECLITHDHLWDNPFIDDILYDIFKQLDSKAFLTVIVDTCLSKDTKIPLLDGTEKTIKELAEGDEKEYWVYSSLPDGQIVPGKAHSARITGKRKLIKVNLDNNKFIECTEDHLFMMRDGSYKKAGSLLSGDSLMPLYRRKGANTEKSYLNGYEMIHTINSESERRRWIPTHILIRDHFGLKTDSRKSICHHKNFNKEDNRPENLEMMSWHDHKKSHGEVGAKNFKEVWSRPEFRKWRSSQEYKDAQSKIIKESWKKEETKESHRKGVEKRLKNEGRRYPKQLEKWNNSDKNLEHLKNMSQDPKINKIRSEKSKKFWDSEAGQALRERRKKKSYENHKNKNIIKNDCEFCCPNNHKVVSIEDTGRVEFVYDLTVEKYHNFATSSGVFVHNCHSGTITRGLQPSNCGNPEDKAYRKDKYIVPPLDILVRALDRDLERKIFGAKSGSEIEQRHILLSGCKESETSKELRYGGEVRGAMTFNLTKLLRSNPDQNWEEVHKFVHQAVKNMQNPQLRGKQELKVRKVFGGK